MRSQCVFVGFDSGPSAAAVYRAAAETMRTGMGTTTWLGLLMISSAIAHAPYPDLPPLWEEVPSIADLPTNHGACLLHYYLHLTVYVPTPFSAPLRSTSVSLQPCASIDPHSLPTAPAGSPETYSSFLAVTPHSGCTVLCPAGKHCTDDSTQTFSIADDTSI